jgi:ribosomal protein S27AE
MGKIVKYCNSCEEGFAEKFGFCPNCGSSLTAFEMNPLGGAREVSAPVKIDSANGQAETINSPVASPAVPVPVEVCARCGSGRRGG